MRLLVVTAIAGVTIAFAASGALAQDFDCARAHGAVEKAICGSESLRSLDEEMGVQYGYARRFKLTPEAEKRLMSEQKAWLKQRNSCGAETGCLEKVYRARIEVLGNEAETRRE